MNKNNFIIKLMIKQSSKSEKYEIVKYYDTNMPIPRINEVVAIRNNEKNTYIQHLVETVLYAYQENLVVIYLDEGH